MTDIYPVTAVATGVLGLVAGALVPRLIAAVPEPEPEEPEEPEAAADDADDAVDVEDESEPEEQKQFKELYADIAARPGLPWKCALASAVSAAAMGLVLGWSWSLVVVLPLVPVGVALAVVDWRTRMLPTRLIAPTYAMTLVAVLVPGWPTAGTWQTWNGPRSAGWSTAACSSCSGSSTRAASATATCGSPAYSGWHWVGSAGRSSCWASGTACSSAASLADCSPW